MTAMEDRLSSVPDMKSRRQGEKGVHIVPPCPICGQAPKITEGFMFEHPDLRYKIQCPNPHHQPIAILAPTPILAVKGWYRLVEHYLEKHGEEVRGIAVRGLYNGTTTANC